MHMRNQPWQRESNSEAETLPLSYPQVQCVNIVVFLQVTLLQYCNIAYVLNLLFGQYTMHKVLDLVHFDVLNCLTS